MGPLLIVLFIIIPVFEIAVFITIGGTIGLWPTIVTIILTAFVGAFLLKKHGLATLFRAQSQFDQGQFPLEEIFEALCLVISAILLITPGFFTDSIGFLLFAPPLRAFLKKIASNTLIARSNIHVYTDSAQNEQTNLNQEIIDGEFEEIKPTDNSNVFIKFNK